MKPDTPDFYSLREKYRQELLALQQQSEPVTAAITQPKSRDVTSQTTLQIRVTAANLAIPVSGAVVTVSPAGKAAPLYVLTTDNSGLTETVVLPATDPSLTQQPTENIPLVTYDIHIAAPGYFSVLNSDVPLFGDVPTVQPVTMIPLPEFGDPATSELRFSVPRNNL